MKSNEERGHEIIRINKYTDPSTSTPYYNHSNAPGPVRAITDSEGKIIERINYYLYAIPTITYYKTEPVNPSQITSSLIGNGIMLQGWQYDKEPNLYYYRAWYYAPRKRHFLQTAHMNLYQSLNQNTANFTEFMSILLTHEFHYMFSSNAR